MATYETVGELRRAATDRLRRSFRDEPGKNAVLDARLIVAHVLGIAPGAVPLADDRPVDDRSAAAIAAMIARRITGEPVARLTGRKEFWGLDFELSPATLVPRPETETIVEAVLAAFAARGWTTAPVRLLDLGTGTGCVLLALLSELPAATGIAVDRSAEAAATARRNARSLGLADRASFAVGDWAAAVGGRFHGIVTNPPYISAQDIAGLAPEVRDHDPRLALDGGDDGLAPYRTLIPDVLRLLMPDGVAVAEVGAGQAPQVADIAIRSGLLASMRKDLAGVDRAVELTAA